MTPGQPAGGHRRGVSEVDEDTAVTELEQAWAYGGYHGFCVMEHSLWCAITSSGEVLTGNTPDALDQAIRAHWQALQPADGCVRWAHVVPGQAQPVRLAARPAAAAAGPAAAAATTRPVMLRHARGCVQ